MGTPKDMMITTWRGHLSDRMGSDLVLAVPGIKLTGWWPGELPDIAALREFDNMWPEISSTILREVDIFEDADGMRHQMSAYVQMLSYPRTWVSLIGESLRLFLAFGAAISWGGGWECFLRYTPSESFAGCYAAYTADTGLICGGDLDEPFVYLDRIPGATQRLHQAVWRRLRSHRAN